MHQFELTHEFLSRLEELVDVYKRQVYHLKIDSGIQGIRETIFKHPAQLRIFQLLFYLRNRLFYGF